MAQSTRGSKKPQRRFQFIDNSDLSSGSQHSTQVRRHVMQEHMRAKRHEARVKAETAHATELLESPSTAVLQQPLPELPVRHNLQQIFHHPISEHQQRVVYPYGHQAMPTPPEPAQATATVEQQAEYFQEPVRTQQSTASATAIQPFVLTAASFAALVNLLPIEPISPSCTIQSESSSTTTGWSEHLSSPSSVLSAARTDPFNSLPIPRSWTADDHEIQELFDFYAFVMPSCTYGFDRRHHKAHNWYRDIFIPEAMKGPVTFRNTILVHAANTQDWKAEKTDSPLALKYRDLAISSLSDHYLKYPADTSDEVITATMSAAALEDFDPRPERKPNAWTHWNAASNKIRQAGGPDMLRYKSSLRKLINWQDYIMSGYDGCGSSFYFTPDKKDHDMSSSAKVRYGMEEVASQCEEFLTFLNCAEHLALAHSQSLSHIHNSSARSLRLKLFESTHPLFILLASSNQERYTKTGEIKQIISRLAALMTINVALWEYRYDYNLSELFFSELEQNIQNNELDKNISVEALIQVLLSGSEHPELRAEERPWLVGRLLKVAKRLSRSSWEMLNDFLLSCLTLKLPQGSMMSSWEPQLRTEILGAPLVSYRLPLMQA